MNWYIYINLGGYIYVDLTLKWFHNIICSGLDPFEILDQDSLLVWTSFLVGAINIKNTDQTRRLSSGLNTNQTRLDSPFTSLMLLTVRISVRSTRFLITADSSSGVTSPFPIVNPSKKSLFHCSSGAEKTYTKCELLCVWLHLKIKLQKRPLIRVSRNCSAFRTSFPVIGCKRDDEIMFGG